MICAACGKESKHPLCDECFAKKHELFSIENISINVCKTCKAGDDLEDKIRSSIKTKNKINEITLMKKEVGNKIHIDVTAYGVLLPRNAEKKETKRIVAIVSNKMCENCIKIRGNYYEAVIQIRGESAEKLLDKLIDRLKNKIAAIDKIKQGYDVRLIDKKSAAFFVQDIRRKHSVTQSYKLVGKKKGKELYRNYYAVR